MLHRTAQNKADQKKQRRLAGRTKGPGRLQIRSGGGGDPGRKTGRPSTVGRPPERVPVMHD